MEHQSMNPMVMMNEDELFYKEYYEAGKKPETLKKFLESVDIEDAVKRHLVIPELLPEIISHEMKDTEYFKEDDDTTNIIISKHNRYTPAFLHRHDFYEIILVFTGSCIQTIGNERRTFSEGDIIFIAPKVYHTMEVFDEDSIILNVLLRKETFYRMFYPLMKGQGIIQAFFSENLYNAHRIRYLVFHKGRKNLIETQQQMMLLYKQELYRDEYSDQIMIGMLTALIGFTMRNDRDVMESSYDQQDIHTAEINVMSYIQNNLATVTLNELADHFGFSVSYCSRLIKSSTGQNFNEWKRALRIREAEQLLLHTDKPIWQISEKLGYDNVETFIRAFKAERHITPAKYRKQTAKSS